MNETFTPASRCQDCGMTLASVATVLEGTEIGRRQAESMKLLTRCADCAVKARTR